MAKPFAPPRYIARLCNNAGELDFVSADSIRTLARHLGKRLIAQEWLLADGDTIHIERREQQEQPQGVCIAVAMGGSHCVGRCQDPRDCSARPRTCTKQEPNHG
jgi:hypothetical protein